MWFIGGILLLVMFLGIYCFYLDREDPADWFPQKFTAGDHTLIAHLNQDKLMKGELTPIEYSIHDYSINAEYVRIPDYDIEIIVQKQEPDLSLVESEDE